MKHITEKVQLTLTPPEMSVLLSALEDARDSRQRTAADLRERRNDPRDPIAMVETQLATERGRLIERIRKQWDAARRQQERERAAAIEELEAIGPARYGRVIDLLTEDEIHALTQAVDSVPVDDLDKAALDFFCGLGNELTRREKDYGR